MEHIFEKLNRYFYKKWHLAVLDINRGRWIVEPKNSNILYLKAENANGRHILIQPEKTIAPYYLLVDDVSWPLIQTQHQYQCGSWKPGRMIIETSMHNYQVWIHSSRPLFLEEKRYWLRRLNSDPGADPNNRWGRCPGFRNRKTKYLNEVGYYPLSKLIWIDWIKQAIIPNTYLQNFIHESKNISVYYSKDHAYNSKKIDRSNYKRGDESVTDFAYALALLRRGLPEQYIRDCIRFERINWKNHSRGKRMEYYLDRTIKRAKNIIYHN